MSRSFGAITDAVHIEIAGFKPQSRSQLHGFFTDVPVLLRELGTSFNQAADAMTDHHIHAAVIDMLRELGSVIASTADHAEQVHTTHARQHELWLTD
jgi:hypothetical protein